MEKITIAQKDGNVKELSASSIEDPVKFSWGYSVVLQQPVTLDGATLPLDASINFNGGTVCQMEDGVNIQGSVKLFVNNSDTVSLRILTAECNLQRFKLF